MFNKRYLSILITSLLVISLLIIAFGFEWYSIYAVCRDELLSHTAGFTSADWKYSHTVFFSHKGSPPPITVVFDGPDIAWCHVRRNGFGWEVTNIALLMYSPFPP